MCERKIHPTKMHLSSCKNATVLQVRKNAKFAPALLLKIWMFYQPCDVTTQIHVGERRYITFDYDNGSRFIWSKNTTNKGILPVWTGEDRKLLLAKSNCWDMRITNRICALFAGFTICIRFVKYLICTLTCDYCLNCCNLTSIYKNFVKSQKS